MRKRDYSQHHNHNGVKHGVTLSQKNKKPIKKWLRFILPPILILAVLVIIFFKTPLFKINQIIVSGTNDVDLINQTEKVVKNYLKLKNNHYILFLNPYKLSNFVYHNIKMEKIEVKKKFPDKLLLQITPYVPAMLWQEGDKYFLINPQGEVETQINLSQLEWELPMVSAATSTHITLHQKLIGQNFIDFIGEFNKKIRQANLNLQVEKYILINLRGREVAAMTNRGWKIILTTDNDIAKTIKILQRIVKEKFNEFQPIEYIDLRLEDRIFYK